MGNEPAVFAGANVRHWSETVEIAGTEGRTHYR